MRLDINDLKRGGLITIDGSPYTVLSVKHVHMGRGGASVQAKLRNLRTGKVLDKNFKPADNIEEANIKKLDAEFIYERNGEYWFHERGDKGKRFLLTGDVIGEQTKFLKGGIGVRSLIFNGEVINVELPTKADYKVIEAPPNVKRGTAQGGSKIVTIETGARINAPLFVEEGDLIRINTDTGEYAERAK